MYIAAAGMNLTPLFGLFVHLSAHSISTEHFCNVLHNDSPRCMVSEEEKGELINTAFMCLHVI